MGVCNCSMFCCTLLYVHSSIAIILMGKRELIALLNLSSWCLVMVERLFLAVPQGCLQFVIVVFPDHTHLLFRPWTPEIKAAITGKKKMSTVRRMQGDPKDIGNLLTLKRLTTKERKMISTVRRSQGDPKTLVTLSQRG